MNLALNGRNLIVTGASSGFGRAVSEALLNEGAHLVVNARRESMLDELTQRHPGKVIAVAGDIRSEGVREAVFNAMQGRQLHGMFINAGGPPPGKFMETSAEQWDEAYRSLLQWKVEIIRRFLPVMQQAKYGRILLLESVSVKQPVPSLILSNALRMAVVGMAKTLSDEVAADGITVNVLAPGYHDTPAVHRVFAKAAAERNLTVEKVREDLLRSIPLQRMGTAEELASLAVWLLSPRSAYITGQTITVDGGRVRGSFG